MLPPLPTCYCCKSTYATMDSLRENLKEELDKLTKSDLIDLLLLDENEQKCANLKKMKKQIICVLKSGEAGSSKNDDGDENIKKRRRSEIDLNEVVSEIGSVAVDDVNGSLDNFVGVYMAYSIFHGYLELVIPDTGGADTHLKELMQDYESTQHIKFDFYKIFLLIPKSASCPKTLEERSSRVLKSETLKEKLLNRAGVQKRSYKNSVYKIHNADDSFTYVVAEYATPVQTYKDVMSYNYGKNSEEYKKQRDKVIARFYESLQQILKEHDNCTEYCELIFYDDKYPDGNFRDIADVLLERIQLLKNKAREYVACSSKQ